MDEDQYRAAYNEINPNRCIFEKSITNRRCDCALKHRFVLATREGIACQSESALIRCTSVLDSMRNSARFSLKVITIDGPMPHNKELQVQAGGMLALQSLLSDTESKAETSTETRVEIVTNIHKTLQTALSQYTSIEQLPYGEIVKCIVKYVSRPKRKKK